MNEIINERESGMELNLQELLLTYLRKWKLIAICVVLAVVLALGITVFAITPTYRTGVTIYVNNNRVTENKDYISSGDLSASLHLVRGYMIVSKSDPVLEKAVAKLGDGYTVAELRNAITTEQVGETVIFALNITHVDPEKAALIANVLSEVIPEEGPKVIEGTSARLVNTAKVPTTHFSPSLSRNAVLGAGVGLLLAIAYVTIVFLKDTRIKDENDLTVMFNLPILGRIPDLESEFSGRGYSESSDEE